MTKGPRVTFTAITQQSRDWGVSKYVLRLSPLDTLGASHPVATTPQAPGAEPFPPMTTESLMTNPLPILPGYDL